MSTQQTIESNEPKYVEEESGSHYSNESEEVLEVEELMQEDFDFAAPSKPTPFKQTYFINSFVRVTGALD